MKKFPKHDKIRQIQPNIFLVKDDALFTPPVQDALEGITRNVVLELARKEDLKVYETKLTSYDIYNADEVFVTGSGAGIIAVTEVDKCEVSGGKMGAVTRKLSDLYYEEAKKGVAVFDE